MDEILAQLTPTFDDLHAKSRSEKKLFFRTVSVIGILTNLSDSDQSKTLETPTAELSAIDENVPDAAFIAGQGVG